MLHYCLRYAGFIDVNRKDPRPSRSAIARAVASLKAGSRIVPAAMLDAERLMPKGGFRIRPGPVRARLLDPVEAAAYSYGDRDGLMAEVRGRIAAALAG